MQDDRTPFALAAWVAVTATFTGLYGGATQSHPVVPIFLWLIPIISFPIALRLQTVARRRARAAGDALLMEKFYNFLPFLNYVAGFIELVAATIALAVAVPVNREGHYFALLFWSLLTTYMTYRRRRSAEDKYYEMYGSLTSAPSPAQIPRDQRPAQRAKAPPLSNGSLGQRGQGRPGPGPGSSRGRGRGRGRGRS